ncbi:hypothetical protein SLA2020_419070 [Shorea laevis]
MANPSGNHQEASSSSFNGHVAAGGNPTNGNSGAPPENQVMKHNPGVSLDWTADEQAMLEDGLSNYKSESNIIRYAKIAMQLQNKTVRDVALRCRWMTKKENSKRRKEEHNLTRKNRDKKERVNDPSAKSSHFAARPTVPPFAPPIISMDNDDGIHSKIPDNINLFCQTRDNIHKIMNDLSLNDTPEVMKQMPPLPVKMNEELANSILGRTNLQMQ